MGAVKTFLVGEVFYEDAVEIAEDTGYDIGFIIDRVRECMDEGFKYETALDYVWGVAIEKDY